MTIDDILKIAEEFDPKDKVNIKKRNTKLGRLPFHVIFIIFI